MLKLGGKRIILSIIETNNAAGNRQWTTRVEDKSAMLII